MRPLARQAAAGCIGAARGEWGGIIAAAALHFVVAARAILSL